MKFNTVYLGTSWSALELICIHNKFNVKMVFCEKKRITPKYQEVAVKFGLKITSFNNKEELLYKLDKLIEKLDLFLIYQFDFIIPKQYALTNKFFNFHSGSLKTNRGAHPIIRSILNGDKQTELSLHRINEKVDQGLVLGVFKVNITEDDDTSTIKSKTEKGLPMLLNLLVLFFEGKVEAEFITGGKYYKPINEEDYTINLENDSLQDMRNKIRSQKEYRGAILNYYNQIFYIKEIQTHVEMPETEERIVIEKKRILIKRDQNYISLIINQSG